MAEYFCNAIQKCLYFLYKYRYLSMALKILNIVHLLLQILANEIKTIDVCKKTNKYRDIRNLSFGFYTLQVPCTARTYGEPTSVTRASVNAGKTSNSWNKERYSRYEKCRPSI